MFVNNIILKVRISLNVCENRKQRLEAPDCNGAVKWRCGSKHH